MEGEDGLRVCFDTPDSSKKHFNFRSVWGLAHARSSVYIINNAKTRKKRRKKMGKLRTKVETKMCIYLHVIDSPKLSRTKYRIAEPTTQQRQAVGTIPSFITISVKTTTTTTGRIGV